MSSPGIGPPSRAPRVAAIGRVATEAALLVFLAVVVALALNAFVVQAFVIPTASMAPQLSEGDRVIVSRLSYRLHDPNRGDIVVFHDPNAPAEDRPLPQRLVFAVLEALSLTRPPEQEVIKRVIGLPGERVEARNGTVLIDGRPLREPYQPAGATTTDFGPLAVPEGHFFVLGDNRANSLDSRSPAVGAVPHDAIVGRATHRIWPPARMAFL